MLTASEQATVRALRDAFADADAGPADPAVLTRLTARAARRGRALQLRRRAGAAALPIGVAAAVGATVLLPGGSGVGPTRPSTTSEAPIGLGRPDASAHDLFLAASVRRLSSPAADGPVYWYREVYLMHTVPVPGGPMRESRGEQYVARSDAGDLRTEVTTDGRTQVETLHGDQAKYSINGLYKAGYEQNGLADWVRLYTKAEIRALPADPTALAAIMDEGLAPDVPVAAEAANRLGVVVSLMYTPVTPAVQAAAFRVLAATPGITAVGVVTDPLGRTGTGFDAVLPKEVGGQSFRLILADDGKVLSLNTTVPGSGESTWTAFEDSGYRVDLG
ncbi:hypothetical protein I6A60_28285 [Frankia sp. AgB1.9]|uniref:hypothetical protein n=1 Tax=unclassified Frankia TaxID=2632575 RepID=UPI0019315137|nr:MULTISPECIES: hypothetical protein [unclassified Frankia]MBL7492111.1 hypothetical protein [Frankia sp. AgW1.1]MBL7551730.1 hypothetical protein [Frankia sp. AgB1.9]MBL7623536.1 hypothetical protein [Frankia sp. AgB1.8]